MLKSGLVSISFRALPVSEICRIAQRSFLQGIEWGGDVHVPPGDMLAAREAQRLTVEYGLQVAAYGSYYRAGTGMEFTPVLDSALALGAPSIRVWAGEASALCDAQRRVEIVRDLNEVTQQATAHGLVVATEYHSGTLTDTSQSAVQLLKETAASGMRTLWQPQVSEETDIVEANRAALRAVRARLLNVHVYHWTVDASGQQRRPLSEGRAHWARYLAELHGMDAWALLEFVRDDEPAHLEADARTLNDLLGAESCI